MNVKYVITELQSRGPDSKLEILVQKIKVKKEDFYSYVLVSISDYILIYTARRRNKLPFF